MLFECSIDNAIMNVAEYSEMVDQDVINIDVYVRNVDECLSNIDLYFDWLLQKDLSLISAILLMPLLFPKRTRTFALEISPKA